MLCKTKIGAFEKEERKNGVHMMKLQHERIKAERERGKKTTGIYTDDYSTMFSNHMVVKREKTHKRDHYPFM